MVALIESRRSSERLGKGMVVSVAVHSAIVTTLLATGGQAETAIHVAGPGESVTWIDPSAREQPDNEHHTGSSEGAADIVDIPADAPESESLPTTVPLFGVEVNVPLADVQLPPLKLDSLMAAPRRSNAGSSSRIQVHTGGGGEHAIHAAQAERLPIALRPPLPHYPALLRDRAIEGAVLVQFTIDRRGLVQPASIRILDSDQSLFDDEVRRALTRARYRPAEIAGRPVAVIVQQRFAFRLERSN